MERWLDRSRVVRSVSAEGFPGLAADATAYLVSMSVFPSPGFPTRLRAVTTWSRAIVAEPWGGKQNLLLVSE